ncbi:O-antigen ligase family protein [Puniceicoccus vermicola]|uniref:O-antigen ligase family protein n=1 Tax=Puniceicoccus vermicola TaxID=388746 RepID=A0A7X1B0I8_9BACT|nr:O-antigen ligase family protein [Puniceicoccus vermicola]MBC2603332.1 O-antigen ligase family protein [Puniceicoccus vermicola]
MSELSPNVTGEAVASRDHRDALLDQIAPLRGSWVGLLLTGAVLLWLLYLASNFRPPTQPITLSDSNSGSAIRQLLFAGTGMLAVTRLFFSRSLGPVVIMHLPVLGILGLILGSVLWSAEATLTIKRGIIYAFGIITLLVMVHSTDHPARQMMRILVYFCTAAALLSLAFYVALPANITVNPARPGLAGISNHPNTLAPFLSIGLLLSFGMPPQSTMERWLILGSRGILALGLFLTFSVTTWTATLIGCGAYLFFSASNYRRGFLQICILTGIVLVSLIGVDTLKSAFFDATGRDESLSGRDELWNAVWIEAKKDILLGNGYGAFWTEGKGRELVQTWNPRQSHNTYLDILVDLGIIGLIAVLIVFPLRIFLSWTFVSGSPGSRQRNCSAAMLAVVISYMSIYAMSQSFFLRFDAFPFFAICWITLIFTNPDRNHLNYEFSQGN